MSSYYIEGLDPVSYIAGMVEAFCEIVSGGIKPLGLSPPFEPELKEAVLPHSERIAEKYGLLTFVEEDFPPTDMLPDSETAGKVVIFYFADGALLDRYRQLRVTIHSEVAAGTYTPDRRAACTKAFRELLGYPVQ